MKYTAIIRGRKKLKEFDDILARVNKTMNNFGFEEKTLFNAEICTANLEVSRELIDEEKIIFTKELKKNFEVEFTDVTVKIIKAD